MCDPNSYPQTPCTPESDTNAPDAASGTGGGGSAFMEMQFYPPGFAPFADAISCDNTHWCSALTIDSLECTEGFAHVQHAAARSRSTSPSSSATACRPARRARRRRPGHRHAQFAHAAMNPGDKIQVHMFDAPVPGGGGAKAFEVVVDDLTTGQSGFMQASAQNGFQNTSIERLLGHAVQLPARVQHRRQGQHHPLGGAADQHQHPVRDRPLGGAATSVDRVRACSRFSAAITDTYYNKCNGPYETGDKEIRRSPPTPSATGRGTRTGRCIRHPTQ